MENKIFSAEKLVFKEKYEKGKSKDNEVHLSINEIRNELKELSKFIKGTIHDATEEDIHTKTARLELEKAILETEKYRNETTNLKSELTDLSAAIQQTKSEIAALSPKVKSPDNIDAVSSELDEIVKSTENATQHILNQAERIDNIAGNISAISNGNQILVNYAHELSESVIGIYESCNFQDLTGQRINKTVKALKFIDEKITNMITIWGEEAIAELAEKVKKSKTGDESLLNGPSLSKDAISQDEIDKFFP